MGETDNQVNKKMKTINYNRPALHRKYIAKGKMTIAESDRIVQDWNNKFKTKEEKINELVQELGLGIIKNKEKWEDLHGYQDDKGNWEV